MSEEVGKLFIGAMSWKTTSEKMSHYFSQFGHVEESVVMKDKMTGDPRGFGFVKFSDSACVTAVLNSRPHFLDGKQVDPKPCTPKDIQIKKKEAERQHTVTHKIFIGGLPREITKEQVQAYFRTFGEITDVAFAINKEDKQNKGFGFVTFEDAAAADEAVKQKFHTILGKRIEAKCAQTREEVRIQNAKKDRNQSNGNDHSYGNRDLQRGYPGHMGGRGEGAYAIPSSHGYGPPSGGYMPSSGYAPPPPPSYDSGYGTYGAYSGYGGYSSGDYNQMGSYYQSSPAGPARGYGGGAVAARPSYHPYK